MIFDIMFYFSLISMWTFTLVAGLDKQPTMMFLASIIMGCFTAVFYHLKADSK